MAAVANFVGVKRKRDDHIQTLPKKVRKSSSDDGESATPDAEEVSDRETTKTSNKHTKKERKTNRSSRIHSLKKLLTRDTLPSNIRQDKERELAALKYDQAKHKSKKQNKKVLEKYHYVRFIERQKAEKRLKQLQKSLQDEEEDAKRSKTRQDIHEMEVNRNYAIYAPLHEKYVSVFVRTKGSKSEGDKPMIWYEIEAAMQEGQSALEALRDGKRRLKLSDNNDLASRKQTDTNTKTRTKKSSIKPGSELRNHSPTGEMAQSDALDDDMSDGGFFQR